MSALSHDFVVETPQLISTKFGYPKIENDGEIARAKKKKEREKDRAENEPSLNHFA